MILKFLKRDFKFGTEKSIKYIIIFIIFVLIPLINYILFSKEYSDIIENFLLPQFGFHENVFKYNVFIITLQVFVLLIYCMYIYDDLFTYNKLILTRYKSKILLCITKIVFVIIYNFILIFAVIFTCYITCKVANININNINILIKILISYSIGAISLSLFNLLISMIFNESIGFLITVISISLNLIFETYIFPGGGYITSLIEGRLYGYSITYNIITTIIISILLIKLYKKVDLI